MHGDHEYDRKQGQHQGIDEHHFPRQRKRYATETLPRPSEFQLARWIYVAQVTIANVAAEPG